MMCDKLTREKGILTKMIIVNDFRGSSMNSIDKKFFMALGKSSKAAEKLYPQLVEKTIIVNPPSSIKMILSMAKLFMSKRSVEKMVYCKGNLSKKEKIQPKRKKN